MEHHKDEAAEQAFRECLGLVRSYGLEHPKANFLLINLSQLLKRRGKPGEAQQLLEEALQARRAHYPPNHYLIADVLVIQALLLGQADSSSRRRHLLREALAIYCEAPHLPQVTFSSCVRQLTEIVADAEAYDIACQLACAGAGRREPSAEREQLLDLAMAALRRARQKGFQDVGRLEHDPKLQGLRPRKDFQHLLEQLRGMSGP
jgi:hypothetical protein